VCHVDAVVISLSATTVITIILITVIIIEKSLLFHTVCFLMDFYKLNVMSTFLFVLSAATICLAPLLATCTSM